MTYDSRQDTQAHITRVQDLVAEVAENLNTRADKHDVSKLEDPEKSVFDEVTPHLKAMTYGSEEYKASRASMGTALTHHYEHNSHHPEHYPNGMEGMSLLDLIEMLCDWTAAGERHSNGNLIRSVEINRERFGYPEMLQRIFENTAQEMGW